MPLIKLLKILIGEISKYILKSKIFHHQQEILNIQRKVAVNEHLYNFLLQRKANIKIGKASIVPEIKLLIVQEI
jgi:uncharacterized protein involved in exopolysaccharide biosynthesis